MSRTRFTESCGVAQALEALGDWWTLLIVRDAFFGARRFGQFEKSLGIAKNVLSARLAHLVKHDIFERVDVGAEGEHFEYHLTEKGEALLPVLTTLREWSDDWIFGRGHEPVVFRDRRTNQRIPKLKVTSRDGRELHRRDIRAEAGPGASAEMRERLRPRERPGAGQSASTGAR